jgi:hypothetical protein
MDFIKNLYEEGLVEKKLDEDVWADIRARRIGRMDRDRSVALYGYLVGIENAVKARRFVEMTEQGKSIPSQFVKGYEPIVAMIDEIVEAGPGAVQRLKQLHKSVKKGR